MYEEELWSYNFNKLIKHVTVAKKKFEQVYPTSINDAAPRGHSLLNKNVSVRPSCELLFREVPEAHESTQAIMIGLGAHP